MEVVWAKSARGVGALGHVFDGKLYFTRDICEEKWIPKDLVPTKKPVPAPKARAKAAPQPRAKPAAKRTGLAVQAGAKTAAKPAPRAIASSSSASATHPVPVMQSATVQSVLFSYPEVLYRSFGSSITFVLDEAHWHQCESRFTRVSLLASVEGTTLCLEIPLQPPPPGRPSLGDRLPPHPGDRRALTRRFARGAGARGVECFKRNQISSQIMCCGLLAT